MKVKQMEKKGYNSHKFIAEKGRKLKLNCLSTKIH
jgi:hypothetical protein